MPGPCTAFPTVWHSTTLPRRHHRRRRSSPLLHACMLRHPHRCTNPTLTSEAGGGGGGSCNYHTPAHSCPCASLHLGLWGQKARRSSRRPGPGLKGGAHAAMSVLSTFGRTPQSTEASTAAWLGAAGGRRPSPVRAGWAPGCSDSQLLLGRQTEGAAARSGARCGKAGSQAGTPPPASSHPLVGPRTPRMLQPSKYLPPTSNMISP